MTRYSPGLSARFRVSPDIYPGWLVAKLRKRLKRGSRSFIRSSAIARIMKILTAMKLILNPLDDPVKRE
jgi:hypothetical protein